MADVITNVINEFRNYIGWTFDRFGWGSVLDILLVTAVFYALLYAIRGTQAVQLLRGLIVVSLIIVLITTSVQGTFTAFGWLVDRTLTALLVAIPVIFQPELRRGLERLGRAGLMLRSTPQESATQIVNSIARAARELSDRRHGALMVIEQETGLQQIAETGVRLDAAVTSDLLITIFHPKTPLHDGAVIIRDARIIAATAVLPLSESPPADRHIGTRHLAAIGVTEVSDAIAVIVSEETGAISVARHGRMVRNLDDGRLARLLHRWYATRSRRFPELLRPEYEDGAELAGDGAGTREDDDGSNGIDQMAVEGSTVMVNTE